MTTRTKSRSTAEHIGATPELTRCRTCFETSEYGAWVAPGTWLVPSPEVTPRDVPHAVVWYPRCDDHYAAWLRAHPGEDAAHGAITLPHYRMPDVTDFDPESPLVADAVVGVRLPGCYVCGNGLSGYTQRFRSARYVAPLAPFNELDRPARWVPICAWHRRDWYSGIYDYQCLPIYGIYRLTKEKTSHAP